MTKCQCQKEKTITLSTKELVCNYCYKYMAECEAREMLREPLGKRREMLSRREEKRGNVEALKQAMINIHNSLK